MLMEYWINISKHIIADGDISTLMWTQRISAEGITIFPAEGIMDIPSEEIMDIPS